MPRSPLLLTAVAVLVLLSACGQDAAEPVGTADPADVAARLVTRLDTATAEIGLPVDGRKFNTVTCAADGFEVAAKDRYTVVVRYHFVPEGSAENNDVSALYEYWGGLGWKAEIRYNGGPGRDEDNGVGHSGFAIAEATDAGDSFRAETDWLETAVWVVSPCYLFAGEAVWGEITPAGEPA